MTPSRRAEQIIPFLFPADVLTGNILANVIPFVKDDIDGVRFFELLGEPIFNGLVFFFGQLGLVGAEKLVPYDEEHAHVLIQVAGIGSMMDPVMRRRYQYVFQPAHLTYQLRVYKDPPDLGQGIHEDDVEGLKAQVSQRNKVDKTV